MLFNCVAFFKAFYSSFLKFYTYTYIELFLNTYSKLCFCASHYLWTPIFFFTVRKFLYCLDAQRRRDALAYIENKRKALILLTQFLYIYTGYMGFVCGAVYVCVYVKMVVRAPLKRSFFIIPPAHSGYRKILLLDKCIFFLAHIYRYILHEIKNIPIYV